MVFCTQQLSCGRTIIFRSFLAFLISDPNLPFCKGSSLCGVANFCHFKNALIFRILGAFWSGFFAHKNTVRWSYNRLIFRTILAFSIFDSYWPLCNGYSPCIVANFGHSQNALILWILGVFWTGFLQTTTLMWSYDRFSKCYHLLKMLVIFWSGILHTRNLMLPYNRFSHFFGIFNFWTQTDHFGKAIAFASWQILAILKMLSFFEW